MVDRNKLTSSYYNSMYVNMGSKKADIKHSYIIRIKFLIVIVINWFAFPQKRLQCC